MRGNVAIIHLLKASPIIREYTDRIRPSIAIQGELLPLITVTSENVEPTNVKDSSSALDIDDITVQVNALTYDEAYNIATSVRAVLDRYSGTVGGIEVERIRFDGSSDYTEQEASRLVYVTEHQYIVREKRTPEYIKA
jgi:argininosuccinate lyase